MTSDGLDYRLLFESAPGFNVVLQPDAPDYPVVAVSDAYLRATGKTREELVGRSLFAVFGSASDHPTMAALRASLDRVRQTLRPDVMPLQRYDLPPIAAAAGAAAEERHWSPVNSPLLAPDGSLRFIIHRVEDVTSLYDAHRELRAAHDQLTQLSESQFRDLFNFMPQLGWTAQPDGFIDFYNKGWYEYTGTTFEQMQGWGWQSVHDPAHLERVMRDWTAAIQAGQAVEMEFPLRRSDGQFRWFLTRITPIRRADGSIARWVGINVDVHEARARADEERRQLVEEQQGRVRAEAAEKRFRFLAQASAVLGTSLDYYQTLRNLAELAVPEMADWCTVAAVDAQGRLERIAVVHRDPEKRELALAYQNGFPPAAHRAGDLAMISQHRRAVLQRSVSDAGLVAAAQDEAHLAVLRGLGCVSCIMAPMVIRGEVLGVLSLMLSQGDRQFDDADLAVVEEVAARAAMAVDNARLYTEAHRREEVMSFHAEASGILASSLEYEATLQTLARLVVPRFADWCSIELVEEGQIKQVAVAHADPAKMELAREYQRRYPPDPDALTGVANILRTGASELYPDIPDEILVQAARDPDHLRLMRALGIRSGLAVPLVARGSTIGAVSLIWAESDRKYGTQDVAVMEELGRRAGLAVDNARLYRSARKAIELRDEFLSIASHELKTPLAALQLQLGSLRRAADKGTLGDLERVKQRLEKTEGQGARLDRLISELLDVSRITAGRLTLSKARVDLAGLVAEVVDRFSDEAERVGSVMTLRLVPEVTIEADETRLSQVVTNLVGNALKYGAGHPVEIALEVTPAGARLTVADAGIGIAPDDQERIFERFERAVSERHFGGFGLGLWITREIVKAHGGRITVASAPGSGARFIVDLPA